MVLDTSSIFGFFDLHFSFSFNQASTVHNDIAQNLKKLVTKHNCPHLLIYGPSSAGKKTLIMAFLCQMFGPSAKKL
ncbi:hypothetical protein RYX36_037284 [Vicia faba]